MPTYNKLVRGRIPEIIEQSGLSCRTRVLDDQEYVEALNAKLHEELEEQIRQEKEAGRGGFSKRFFLIDLDDV